MKPGSVAAPPALVVCEANGSGCSPVRPGLKLSGNKLVWLERGVSEFELDAVTHVEVGEGSELLLSDSPRTLELRAGGISLSREDALATAGPLTVKMVDRSLLLVGRASIVARMENLNRGQLFVGRGTVTAVEPVGAVPPVRQYHPGEGAVLERKAPPDLTAVFAGKLSRFRQTVLAVVDTSPPQGRVDVAGIERGRPNAVLLLFPIDALSETADCELAGHVRGAGFGGRDDAEQARRCAGAGQCRRYQRAAALPRRARAR
jgi:hypothetical protein